MNITKLIKSPIATFGLSDDDYMQNVVTCTVDFRTYSHSHLVCLKFPIETLPEDLSREALFHDPVTKMIAQKVNTYVRLHIYYKPIRLVNRLMTLKKGA